MVHIARKARKESVSIDVGDGLLTLLVGDGLSTFSLVCREEGCLGDGGVCELSCYDCCATVNMRVGMCTLRRELRKGTACAIAVVQTRRYMAVDATIGLARCGAVTGFGERVRLYDLRRCLGRSRRLDLSTSWYEAARTRECRFLPGRQSVPLSRVFLAVREAIVGHASYGEVRICSAYKLGIGFERCGELVCTPFGCRCALLWSRRSAYAGRFREWRRQLCRARGLLFAQIGGGGCRLWPQSNGNSAEG